MRKAKLQTDDTKLNSLSVCVEREVRALLSLPEYRNTTNLYDIVLNDVEMGLLHFLYGEYNSRIQTSRVLGITRTKLTAMINKLDLDNKLINRFNSYKGQQ